ncbi:MAG: hypothetical protein WBA57_14890 [Elainellaceae cyanobacterium]
MLARIAFKPSSRWTGRWTGWWMRHWRRSPASPFPKTTPDPQISHSADELAEQLNHQRHQIEARYLLERLTFR